MQIEFEYKEKGEALGSLTHTYIHKKRNCQSDKEFVWCGVVVV